MKGEWCYYKEYFDPNVCNKIIELGSKLPSQSAKMGYDDLTARADDSWRKSTIRFIERSNPDFTWLFDSIWKMAIEANDQWFGFHISKLDYIQLAEYNSDTQDEYKKHHDVFWMNNDPYYHRKLTCVIQLSDPTIYEGGNLEMCNITNYPPVDDVRSQGTAFFFPSFLEHQATKVTKGTRYSLACWFDGKKWT